MKHTWNHPPSWTFGKVYSKIPSYCISGQITIFHQPGFPQNKRNFPEPQLPFGVVWCRYNLTRYIPPTKTTWTNRSTRLDHKPFTPQTSFLRNDTSNEPGATGGCYPICFHVWCIYLHLALIDGIPPGKDRWRSPLPFVLVYDGPLQIATFWEWRSPSTFTTV